VTYVYTNSAPKQKTLVQDCAYILFWYD